MKVGIIGGTGKIGQLFRGVFERGGYEVVCSGRHTDVTPRQIAGECDIVMVAVPIHATVPVINGMRACSHLPSPSATSPRSRWNR